MRLWRFGRSTIQAEEKQFFLSMWQYGARSRTSLLLTLPSSSPFFLKKSTKIIKVKRNLSKLFDPNFHQAGSAWPSHLPPVCLRFPMCPMGRLIRMLKCFLDRGKSGVLLPTWIWMLTPTFSNKIAVEKWVRLSEPRFLFFFFPLIKYCVYYFF